MSLVPLTLAGASLAIWAVLVFARGGFWRARERLDDRVHPRVPWPAVVAVVPARDEAGVIGRTIASVVDQDYPGPLTVVLVDDHSTDGTAELARLAAERRGRGERLRIVVSRPLPGGWTGKLWALSEGLDLAAREAPNAPFVWFTDADIEHDPDTLRSLVAKVSAEDRDLVSVMARLSCEGPWERLLVPPFVFFFAMLYPFAWVNDRRRRTAAAAGGCVLLRREALARAGGLAAIRGEIIDDCALARAIKARGREGGGSLWLGLTGRVRSVRPYTGLSGIWGMVARSAYTQLRHSPVLLGLTIVGMILVYLVPPGLVLSAPWHENLPAAALGALAWVLMTVAFMPMIRFYGLAPWRALLLPGAAVLYCAMTIDSAAAHGRGRGGAWKGRTQGGSIGSDATF
ncbi:glycosyltransferase [Salinarimonas soli]|uniref:Glycosyltransferase n=1 Tax=Salinarimonas soli TaxID=1638099 RepID=A0A5B2VA89_9HYPH|nr:glycosyltransferase [Salinarimonas soli]KAA2235648.1 glycosyltransferase [Salinarimonas soli]